MQFLFSAQSVSALRKASCKSRRDTEESAESQVLTLPLPWLFCSSLFLSCCSPAAEQHSSYTTKSMMWLSSHHLQLVMLSDSLIVPESLTGRVGLSIKNHLQMEIQQILFCFCFFYWLFWEKTGKDLEPQKVGSWCQRSWGLFTLKCCSALNASLSSCFGEAAELGRYVSRAVLKLFSLLIPIPSNHFRRR